MLCRSSQEKVEESAVTRASRFPPGVVAVAELFIDRSKRNAPPENSTWQLFFDTWGRGIASPLYPLWISKSPDSTRVLTWLFSSRGSKIFIMNRGPRSKRQHSSLEKPNPVWTHRPSSRIQRPPRDASQQRKFISQGSFNAVCMMGDVHKKGLSSWPSGSAKHAYLGRYQHRVCRWTVVIASGPAVASASSKSFGISASEWNKGGPNSIRI